MDQPLRHRRYHHGGRLKFQILLAYLYFLSDSFSRTKAYPAASVNEQHKSSLSAAIAKEKYPLPSISEIAEESTTYQNPTKVIVTPNILKQVSE